MLIPQNYVSRFGIVKIAQPQRVVKDLFIKLLGHRLRAVLSNTY